MEGISHITFVVRDLERMAVFLCEGLGAHEVYDSAGRNHSLSREKFFVLGGVWIAAMEGDSRIRGEGLSLYFHDFENHLFELHTGTLEQRLAAYGVAR
ncbi:FosX/FosE/FosI family fosfomycin resistance thiol transferase [Luteimonas salinilitoris]|uniref:FosX/FosE/FosI family fosfomycin resistance thiol transferase n=1 Tax=Luteimonas salinilitoris TaxID=3237697 RepID=A0ABV4HQD7_9GAMM